MKSETIYIMVVSLPKQCYYLIRVVSQRELHLSYLKQLNKRLPLGTNWTETGGVLMIKPFEYSGGFLCFFKLYTDYF